jgi:5-methyltetrahydrofolate--homocysteine methyltransferase
MSVFLTSCCKAVEETVAALRKAGLRDEVSIMIGGAAASALVAQRTGCDYYGETAVHAARHASSVAASG